MKHSFIFVMSAIIVNIENGGYPFVICKLDGCDVVWVWYIEYSPFVCVNTSIYPNN